MLLGRGGGTRIRGQVLQVLGEQVTGACRHEKGAHEGPLLRDLLDRVPEVVDREAAVLCLAVVAPCAAAAEMLASDGDDGANGLYLKEAYTDTLDKGSIPSGAGE